MANADAVASSLSSARPTVDVLCARAGSALSSGEAELAESLYNDAINHSPTPSARLHSNRAAARLSRGNSAAALADAMLAVSLAPNWSKAHARLGSALAAAGRVDEAIEAFQRAMRCDLSSARGLFGVRIRH